MANKNRGEYIPVVTAASSRRVYILRRVGWFSLVFGILDLVWLHALPLIGDVVIAAFGVLLFIVAERINKKKNTGAADKFDENGNAKKQIL